MWVAEYSVIHGKELHIPPVLSFVKPSPLLFSKEKMKCLCKTRKNDLSQFIIVNCTQSNLSVDDKLTFW